MYAKMKNNKKYQNATLIKLNKQYTITLSKGYLPIFSQLQHYFFLEKTPRYKQSI